MDQHARITIDPRVLAGKPTIRGTRIAVEHVMELLGQGWSEADVLAAFPSVTRDDVLACVRYTG
jgi:uncharacterized protein (DUF433 family)